MPRVVDKSRSHQRDHRNVRQRRSATGVTGEAISVYTATQSLGVGGISAVRLMLVFMVAEMLRGRAGLVLAIASNRRPGELERQENEKEDGKPATHDGHCNRVRSG